MRYLVILLFLAGCATIEPTQFRIENREGVIEDVTMDCLYDRKGEAISCEEPVTTVKLSKSDIAKVCGLWALSGCTWHGHKYVVKGISL